MITGVVLAAGAGMRIGHPKALLETATAHESFLARACRVLRDAGAEHMIVVTAPALAHAARTLMGGEATIVVNPDPERGQLSSLQCAIASLTPLPEALVVLPVDVPLVSEDTARRLIARWRETRAPVVRPFNGARHGHPVVFDRVLLPQLAQAGGPGGAKPIVRAHASAAGEVEVTDEGAFLDIDSPEDYRRAFNKLPTSVLVR